MRLSKGQIFDPLILLLLIYPTEAVKGKPYKFSTINTHYPICIISCIIRKKKGAKLHFKNRSGRGREIDFLDGEIGRAHV